MSRSKLDKKIGKAIYSIVALWLVFTAAILAKAQEVKHFSIPSGPIDGKMTEDLLQVTNVDCDYIATSDGQDHRQIAVVLVKIYRDKSFKRLQLPHVFSTRRDAFQACGAWQDQVEKDWKFVHQFQRQARVEQ